MQTYKHTKYYRKNLIARVRYFFIKALRGIPDSHLLHDVFGGDEPNCGTLEWQNVYSFSSMAS